VLFIASSSGKPGLYGLTTTGTLSFINNNPVSVTKIGSIPSNIRGVSLAKIDTKSQTLYLVGTPNATENGPEAVYLYGVSLNTGDLVCSLKLPFWANSTYFALTMDYDPNTGNLLVTGRNPQSERWEMISINPTLGTYKTIIQLPVNQPLWGVPSAFDSINNIELIVTTVTDYPAQTFNLTAIYVSTGKMVTLPDVNMENFNFDITTGLVYGFLLTGELYSETIMAVNSITGATKVVGTVTTPNLGQGSYTTFDPISQQLYLWLQDEAQSTVYLGSISLPSLTFKSQVAPCTYDTCPGYLVFSST